MSRPPESSLSQSDHLLRGAWALLVLGWALVCVVQATSRLRDLARGATYPYELAWTDALHWMRPMLALAVGGFLMISWWGRGRSPGLGLRGVMTPLLATLAGSFAWLAVLLVARLF